MLRLEMCAVVLDMEIGEIISEQLNIPFQNMTFYTDIKVGPWLFEEPCQTVLHTCQQ